MQRESPIKMKLIKVPRNPSEPLVRQGGGNQAECLIETWSRPRFTFIINSIAIANPLVATAST
jgi:hypothetical protein